MDAFKTQYWQLSVYSHLASWSCHEKPCVCIIHPGDNAKEACGIHQGMIFFPLYFLSASELLEDLGPFTFFKIILSCISESTCVSKRTWGHVTGIALGFLQSQTSVTRDLVAMALLKAAFSTSLEGGLRSGFPGCLLASCDCSAALFPCLWVNTHQQPVKNRGRKCFESCPYPSSMHVQC